jgi:hypothetical protein
MKAKEFQKILLDTSEHLKRDYISRFNAKIMRFEALYSYLSKFISVEDKNTLTNDIYSTFITLFLAKESANFPPNAPINSMLTFFEINTNKIQVLIDEFNAIDFEETINFNEPILQDKDFGTYTQTEAQNNLFFRLQNIITEISKLEALNKTILKAPLVQAFQYMLHYDLRTQELKPNASYILGTMRGI